MSPHLGLAALALLAACAGTTVRDTQGVRDTEGRPLDPLAGSQARATVLLFTDTECPIANAYAPEIRRLAAEFAPRGVRFFLVYADPARGAAEVQAHRDAFGYALPALLDPAHELVARAGATTTPEAGLFLPTGELVYRGRIDDRFVELGRERPAATRRDLRDALVAVLAGKPVNPSHTQAVGCFIADMK